MSIKHNSVAEVAAAYTKLVKQMRDQGIEPVAWTVQGVNTETVLEDYTAYDRGDLCSELDRALGDLIERTMHRYMPKKMAHNVRRTTVSGLADKVIEYDQSTSHSPKA